MFVEEKIDLVLQKIDKFQQFVELFVPDLTKLRNVAKFLEVSDQCIHNWLKDDESPIKENEHYLYNIKGNITFIPDAIIELKQAGGYKNRRVKEPVALKMIEENAHAVNPMSIKILQKIGKMPACEETPLGDVL